jgi:hypothetical protein
MASDGLTVECSGARVSENSIAETSSGRPVVEVSRTDILDIALRHGFASERPVVVVACGTLLIGIGLIFVRHLLMWLWQGGVIYVEEGLGIGLIVLGALVASSALRRRYFVAVRTASDLRKLSFGREAARDETVTFVGRAGQMLGCPVRIDLT